jgi:acetyl-CoA acyltransferase 1
VLVRSRRLNTIRNHLTLNKCLNKGKVPAISDDDIVIVDCIRTALCKSGRGNFKDTQPEVMLTGVFSGILERNKLDPKYIEDICVGNVIQTGAGNFTSRMAQFLSKIPETTSLSTVNRLCSSGLQAVMNVAYAIANNQIDCGIGAGVESMSLYDMNNQLDPEKLSEGVFECEGARNCMIPMGITSENVAEKYKVDRKTQDLFAFNSQKKAVQAQKNGLYKEEIWPVKTRVKVKDEWKQVTVDKDEGIRETTLEALEKLKPAFKKDGTTTAGNSSQTTDGAAAVLLARRSFAKKHGLNIKGRIIGYAVAGVPPEIMGIGPAFAIPEALKKVGLGINDIDIYEINEAFASQASYCVNHLKIPEEKVNPKGGAIALGHPLGMTGARQISTLMTELKRTKKRFGVVSMCIGTGMGAACVIERDSSYQ